jgi:hypothetical protein
MRGIRLARSPRQFKHVPSPRRLQLIQNGRKSCLVRRVDARKPVRLICDADVAEGDVVERVGGESAHGLRLWAKRHNLEGGVAAINTFRGAPLVTVSS